MLYENLPLIPVLVLDTKLKPAISSHATINNLVYLGLHTEKDVC